MNEPRLYWGWIRQSGKRNWLHVATGDYDQCRNAISDHAAHQKWKSIESLLTAPGEDPNVRKKVAGKR